MTAPKLGRRLLSSQQRYLLRQYSHWVRDGHPIPAEDRAALADAMTKAGAPTAQDGRRLTASDKRYLAERRAGKPRAASRAEAALTLHSVRVKRK